MFRPNKAIHFRQEVLGRTTHLLSLATTWIAKKTTPRTIRPCYGKVFTKRRGDRDTQTGAKMHIKIGSAVQNLAWGNYRRQGDVKAYFQFCKIRKAG
jgi:hypothetical protein